MRPVLFLFAILLLVIKSNNAYCQEKYSSNDILLESISDDIPQLKKKVSFSTSNIELYEFLRALGTNNKINLNIDPKLKDEIAVNFADVTIKDLLVHLCAEYNLDLNITGNIISITKHFVAPPLPKPVTPKEPSITYDSITNAITVDLQNDTLSSVMKKITELTGYNILIQSKIKQTLISGYIKKMSPDNTINELATVNNLMVTQKDSTTYHLQEISNLSTNSSLNNENEAVDGLTLTTNGIDSIMTLKAINVPLKTIIGSVAKKLNKNYYLFTEMEGNKNLKVDNIDFDNFLKMIFNSTDYSFKITNGVYLIGSKKHEDIHHAEIYKMKHRTLANVVEKIPSDLKKGVEIMSVEELNSIIITGTKTSVAETIFFLEQIDKAIPVINIELIILDIRKSHSITTGIKAGIDNSKTTSSYASVFPSIDMTLSANTINNIIDGINGTGLVNLGKVTPSFYVDLKASEDNGYLKIRSTPRLSTLNAKEATMTIGETRYYIEQTTNVITTQSTTTVTGINYKELQANFGITIKPIVSGDEQITLDISVEQSTFTEQTTKDGPYGRLTRSFKSSVRVLNNDMILLGGLEEKNNSNAGNGLPLLSRVPILKWIFSSRSQSSKKSKLVILIHPTVFY